LFRLLSEAKHAVLCETLDERVDISPVKHILDGWEQGISLHLRPAAVALRKSPLLRRDHHTDAPLWTSAEVRGIDAIEGAPRVLDASVTANAAY